MTTDASLALAVGRRIHPDREWYEGAAGIECHCEDGYWRAYNPLVGADAAEAEAWLAERVNSIHLEHYTDYEGATAWRCFVSKVSRLGDDRFTAPPPRRIQPRSGNTPAEARARIIAAWPGGEG